ncbi:hypothetical protein L596_024858 [Steinernema carpocapsae]|uniref:F-box domain-containing protein n=1 Tax=Steinernema carpocapsae TaxID=34508 RepID=A0A4U5M617_STECR|nr:hypothetical protein L596_024858 [Steinernema carpocapsae]
MGLYLSKLLSPFYSCEPPSLTHIDDLSNEVLVKIFQFLCEPRCWDKAASEVDWYGLPCTNISWNRRQLHKICKVCARWNGIVLEHFKKTDVLDFSLVNGNDMWKNRLQCLDAKYFTTGIYIMSRD